MKRFSFADGREDAEPNTTSSSQFQCCLALYLYTTESSSASNGRKSYPRNFGPKHPISPTSDLCALIIESFHLESRMLSVRPASAYPPSPATTLHYYLRCLVLSGYLGIACHRDASGAMRRTRVLCFSLRASGLVYDS